MQVGASPLQHTAASHTHAYLITWLMMMGSGGISKAWSRWGISENFIRWDSKIYVKEEKQLRSWHFEHKTNTLLVFGKRMGPFLTCWRYLSQMTNSRSWGSWSLCVLIYCHSAWMITGRVWVWMPRSRARRGSNLNWGGCREPKSTGMNILSWDYMHFGVL